jgi:hypothetical protein
MFLIKNILRQAIATAILTATASSSLYAAGNQQSRSNNHQRSAARSASGGGQAKVSQNFSKPQDHRQFSQPKVVSPTSQTQKTFLYKNGNMSNSGVGPPQTSISSKTMPPKSHHQDNLVKKQFSVDRLPTQAELAKLKTQSLQQTQSTTTSSARDALLKSAKRNTLQPIPFPNGNTGINGSGAPQDGLNAGKRHTPIPFPNGNTGINGSGAPQDGLNAGPSTTLRGGHSYYDPTKGKSMTLERKSSAVSQAAKDGSLLKSSQSNFISGTGSTLATPPASQNVVTKPPLVPGSKVNMDRNLLKGMNLTADSNTQATAIEGLPHGNKILTQTTSDARDKAIGALSKSGGTSTIRSFDPIGVVVDTAGAPVKVAVGAAEVIGGGLADAVNGIGGTHTVIGTGPAANSNSSNNALLPVTATVQDLRPVKKLGKRLPTNGEQVVQNKGPGDAAKQMTTGATSDSLPSKWLGNGAKQMIPGKTDGKTPPVPNTPPVPDTPPVLSEPPVGGVGGWGRVVGVLSNLPVGGGFGGGGGQMISSAPASYESPVQYTAAPPVTADAGGVDLVLEDAKLFEDATLVAGPAYSVRFRNQGISSSARFVVAIAASGDGKLSPLAPKATMEVPGLLAGESRELTLRLPRCEFSYLIISVDSTDVVRESDESNNGAVLARGAL